MLLSNTLLLFILSLKFLSFLYCFLYIRYRTHHKLYIEMNLIFFSYTFCSISCVPCLLFWNKQQHSNMTAHFLAFFLVVRWIHLMVWYKTNEWCFYFDFLCFCFYFGLLCFCLFIYILQHTSDCIANNIQVSAVYRYMSYIQVNFVFGFFCSWHCAQDVIWCCWVERTFSTMEWFLARVEYICLCFLWIVWNFVYT